LFPSDTAYCRTIVRTRKRIGSTPLMLYGLNLRHASDRLLRLSDEMGFSIRLRGVVNEVTQGLECILRKAMYITSLSTPECLATTSLFFSLLKSTPAFLFSSNQLTKMHLTTCFSTLFALVSATFANTDTSRPHPGPTTHLYVCTDASFRGACSNLPLEVSTCRISSFNIQRYCPSS
jgi:hypothetical protein